MGAEIRSKVEEELADLYSRNSDGGTPIAYLWACTIGRKQASGDARNPVTSSSGTLTSTGGSPCFSHGRVTEWPTLKALLLPFRLDEGLGCANEKERDRPAHRDTMYCGLGTNHRQPRVLAQ